MKIEKHFFPFRATHQFSDFVSNYQEQNVGIKPFIHSFPSIENLKKQLGEKKYSADLRKVLVSELQRQYEPIKDKQVVSEQLDKLMRDTTYTVTTGHQCCLFTGPLYFIYKIISTIHLAKKMNEQFPEKHIVPVFWMATEDHDFAEVNHIHLQSKTYTYPPTAEGNAVGRITLSEIGTMLTEIEEAVSHLKYGNQAMQVLRMCYDASHTLAQATRLFVHELFKNDGLVIIDADAPLLKQQFKQVLETDISSTKHFDAVTENTKALIENKIIEKGQIMARQTNLFLLENEKRDRIDKKELAFETKTLPHTLSENDLLSITAKNPEKLSPNVALRPLYQETILPNLCYIGGGAEILYWLQLKDLFAVHSIPFPILMIRNSALIMEQNNWEKVAQMGVSLSDIFDTTQTLQKKYLEKNTEVPHLKEELEKIETLFKHIAQKATLVDKTLEKTVEGEWTKTTASIHNIEQKMWKAIKRKEETNLLQIEKFKQKYFPENGLQERYDNFLYFYAKYGDLFLDFLKQELHPLQNEVLVAVVGE